MTRQTVLSPDQFRQVLFRSGKTLTQWAKEHGYTFRECSRVLNGQVKARFGRGHDIAVAMGLKLPLADASLAGTTTYASAQPSTAPAERNPQRRAFG